MNRCPCCDQMLLRQFRNHRLTLFCQTCWQEIPMAKSELFSQDFSAKIISLSQVRSRALQEPA
ncbi:MAG: hypothetical protein HC860_09210 [Alkalinema sp. RU_4_3]|nr:hypothetical protein [Alkalinema sp. RU_4_3]